jgi:DNA-directed RNA polymerase subunit M/transcription elongation factor TFIIS
MASNPSQIQYVDDEDVVKVAIPKNKLLFPKSIPLTAYFYIEKNYNDVRRAKLMMFGDCLGEYSEFQKYKRDKKMEFLKNIERGCYHMTRKRGNKKDMSISWDSENFVNLYHDICYKVVMNLNKNAIKSTELVDAVFSGDVHPKQIAKLTSQEMCPELYVNIYAKIEMSSEGVKIKTSKLYYCSKCKNNKTILNHVQDRSGDENTSTIIYCVFCGHQWRLSG